MLEIWRTKKRAREIGNLEDQEAVLRVEDLQEGVGHGLKELEGNCVIKAVGSKI